jgi:aspartate racemase
MNGRRSAIIGILGGMGPVAAHRFCGELLRAGQADGAVQDEEYLPFILLNLGIPSRAFSEAGVVDSGVVEEHLQKGVKRLVAAGADAIVAPCVSVHDILPEVVAVAGIPLLSILQVTAARIAEMAVKCVGVLGSESTHAQGLWRQILEDQKIACLEPGADGRAAVKKVILAVMGGRHGEYEEALIRQQIQSLEDRGVGAVILGCTELGSVVSAASGGIDVPVVDCVTVLAEGCVRLATEGVMPERGGQS